MSYAAMIWFHCCFIMHGHIQYCSRAQVLSSMPCQILQTHAGYVNHNCTDALAGKAHHHQQLLLPQTHWCTGAAQRGSHCARRSSSMPTWWGCPCLPSPVTCTAISCSIGGWRSAGIAVLLARPCSLATLHSAANVSHLSSRGSWIWICSASSVKNTRFQARWYIWHAALPACSCKCSNACSM